jgi:hypothetical protein
MYKAFHWIIVGILIIFGFWALRIYVLFLQAHMPCFLFLWFFLPGVALLLDTQSVRSTFSSSSLNVVQAFLFVAVVSLSVFFFMSGHQIHDFVGQRFVDGYYRFEDGSIITAHWYSKFGLFLFDLAFLGTCVVLPYVTVCGFVALRPFSWAYWRRSR